jgi:hypothetical protein
MGISIDRIPKGSRTTDAALAEKDGTDAARAAEYGMQPPPASDMNLKRRVKSLGSEYGTQPPPAESDARLKRQVREL